MSRRKQPKPRHLGTDDDSGDVMTIANVDSDDYENHEMNQDVADGAENDAHVCGLCHREFFEIAEFMMHKSQCSGGLGGGSGKRKTCDEDGQAVKKLKEFSVSYQNDFSKLNKKLGDCEGDRSFSRAETDDDDDDEEEEEGLSAAGMMPSSEINDFDKNQTGDDDVMDSEVAEGLDDDYDLHAHSEPHHKGEVAANGLPPFALPDEENFQKLFSQYASHPYMKLNTLHNSNNSLKAVMAQTTALLNDKSGADLSPSDLIFLQTMLYSLQQQQLVQLQLIQQIQHQLLTSSQQPVTPNSEVPSSLSSSLSSPLSGCLPPVLQSVASLGYPWMKPLSAQTPSVLSGDARMNGIKSATTSINNDLGNSSDINDVRNFRDEVPPSLDHSGHGDDSLTFRHKCFYCDKLFGSDSALQIHLRSHTGERPFKCNVCGSRFSTRGNLKVHFQRHKEQFPDIEMNPNPIPEYLDYVDRYQQPPPLLSPAEKKMFSWPFHEKKIFDNGYVDGRNEMTDDDKQVKLYSNAQSEEDGADNRRISGEHSGRTLLTPSAEDDESGDSDVDDEKNDTAEKMNHISSHSLKPSLLPPLTPLAVDPLGPPSSLIHSGAFSKSFLPPPPLMATQSRQQNLVVPDRQDEEDEMLEQFMETLPSASADPTITVPTETNKLEEFVRNMESKLSDPNQCALCHRVLSCRSALQMHYRTHTGERPYRCKLCGRQFTTKGNLKTHMSVHRGKPPLRILHQCPVCHKQFTNAIVLQQHVRMHTTVTESSTPKIKPPGPPVVPSMGLMYPYGQMPYAAAAFPFLLPGFLPPAFPLVRPPTIDQHLANMQSARNEQLDLRKQKHSEDTDDESLDNSKTGGKESSTEMDGELKNKQGDTFNSKDDNDDGYKSELTDKADGPEEYRRKTEFNDKKTDDIWNIPRSIAKSSELIAEERSENSRKLSEISNRYFPYEKSFLMGGDKDVYNNNYSTDEHGSRRSYSSSLLALEEKVKSFDNPSPFESGPHPLRPLEQMENIVRRTEAHETVITNARKQALLGMTANVSDIGDHFNSEKTGGTFSPVSSENSRASSNSSGGSPSGIYRDTVAPISSASFPFGKSILGNGTSPLSRSPFEFMGSSSSSKAHTTCNICLKTFACRSALDIHYRSHTKERPYKCHICERAFSTRGNMKQHLLTHKVTEIPKDLFKRHTPSEQSSNNSSGHVKVMPSSSSANNVSTATSSITESPINPTASTSSSSTVISSAAASSTNLNDQHSEITPSSLSSSTVVKTETPSSTPLVPKHEATHVLSSANNTPTNFTSSASSFDMSSSSRRSALKHACQVCEKPFSSASALQIHMRTHTGDKPFKCTVCGKAFTTKGNLKVHMGTHMWNNSPSRRGRRMSIENIQALNSPQDFSPFPHIARPPADFYPFVPPPGFPSFGANGFLPKINEFPMIPARLPDFGSQKNLTSSSPTLSRESIRDPVIKQQPFYGFSNLSRPTFDQLSPGSSKSGNSEEKKSENLMSPVRSGSSGELDLSLKKPSSTAEKVSTSNTTTTFDSKVSADSRPPVISSAAPISSSNWSPASNIAVIPSLASHLSYMSSGLVAMPPLITSSLGSLMSVNGAAMAQLSMHGPTAGSEKLMAGGAAPWIWMGKLTCHLCRETCHSAEALESHLKLHFGQMQNQEGMRKPLAT